MTYDSTAKKIAVKVIGTVESNLNYGAVNYNDPITVGIAQWYGSRAAAILERMRTTNSGSWYDVEPSIANQLATVNPANAYWNTRYLTLAEGVSLIPVMNRNQAIQNAQLTEDLDAYVTVFESYGFNKDTQTDVLLYFMSMHHQSPASALRVVQTLQTTATLNQIHAATLADSILGRYGARYKTTYDIIATGDFSDVDPAPPVVTQPTQPNGNARIIKSAGDLLAVKFQDGEQVLFYPNGRGQWTPRKAADKPPPPVPVQPPPPADNGNWVLPLTGSPVLTSPYGPRAFDGLASYHYGIDLANSGNAGNVVSPCPLKITVAWEAGTPGDPSQGTAGTYVKGHTLDNAYTFNFFHMVPGTLSVAVGDTTTTGQKLGVEGASGNVTGRHLHFEAFAGAIASPWAPPYGKPIDPLPILRGHGVNI